MGDALQTKKKKKKIMKGIQNYAFKLVKFMEENMKYICIYYA